ncbi:MAG: DUF2065 family protein [Paracoccaceae bacterium]
MTGIWLLVFGLGFVLVAEGLLLALLPGRTLRALELIRELPAETRRLFGLAALGLGVALIWLAERLAG